ncbi:GntR family transcriptional regulator [Listeria monocytogenes]|nr:GntR family transcriptional regulator [Listeria monocytogenes]
MLLASSKKRSEISSANSFFNWSKSALSEVTNDPIPRFA